MSPKTGWERLPGGVVSGGFGGDAIIIFNDQAVLQAKSLYCGFV